MVWVFVTLLLAACSTQSSAQPLSASTAAPDPVLPVGIPREVLLYRNAIIRETRFYWGMGHKPYTTFGQLHQESRFKANARSQYAAGLGQFTPPTAVGIQQRYPKDLRELCDDKTGCPLDPRWAIRATVLYDRDIYRSTTCAQFSPEDPERIACMLASYNSGAGWVIKERKLSKDPSKWFNSTELVCLRKEEFCKETKDYVHVIIQKWTPIYRQWLAPMGI